MLKVNGERLWNSIIESGKIGATPAGGINRQALTDLDKKCRELFINLCRSAGCSITIDQVGNIFARRPGTDNTKSPVMMGSHLDTQPTGGRFDGIYGVLAGLEIIRTLNDHNIETEHPIETVVWTNEEGARFSPPMLGSGAFTRELDLQYVLSCTDAEGKTLDEELRRIGFKGREIPGDHPAKVYFEVHIEQGPILELEDKMIGIVEAAQGQRWFEIKITGEEAHAGPTPMNVRKDALVAASKMIDYVSSLGNMFPPHSRSACGMIEIQPNTRNVIPGYAWFTADIRHPDEKTLDIMEDELRNQIKRITEETNTQSELTEFWSFSATPFDKGCTQTIREATEYYGYSNMEIVSGAGHDAVYLARKVPSGMIFIPCENGISHNEAENTKEKYTTAGANVLLQSVLKYAKGVHR